MAETSGLAALPWRARTGGLPAAASPLLLLAALGCAGAADGTSLREAPEWRTLASGLEMAVTEAAPPAAEGSLLILRLDPRLWRLEPRHYADEGLEEPAGLEEWVRRTMAPVVFNAGFYHPDRSHIGILMRDGRNLGSSLHPKWKGLLVSDPADPEDPPVDILDLLDEKFSVAHPSYRNAVQSLMILKDGVKRVPRTARTASRTAVAVDRRGRFYIVWAEGAHSLWDLADILDRSGLGIRRAMVLDGGREAQLAVETDKVSIRKWGGGSGSGGLLDVQVPLPAVVAVRPRR